MVVSGRRLAIRSTGTVVCKAQHPVRSERRQRGRARDKCLKENRVESDNSKDRAQSRICRSEMHGSELTRTVSVGSIAHTPTFQRLSRPCCPSACSLPGHPIWRPRGLPCAIGPRRNLPRDARQRRGHAAAPRNASRSVSPRFGSGFRASSRSEGRPCLARDAGPEERSLTAELENRCQVHEDLVGTLRIL